MSYLALDIGVKRIGIAISTTAIIVNELETISNDKDAVSKIIEIIKEKQIKFLIVGDPKNMDGTESKMSKYVKKFIQKIKDQIDIKIELVDERLTTQEAYRQLRESGVEKSIIEDRVDQYAAKIILEDYLI